MEKNLAQVIKTLRNRKGYSQEELSGKTGLNLRTIQRIENDEVEPRGDSLRKLAAAFDMSLDDLNDLTADEDRGFLVSLNLSALSFIVFPILGVVVPLIIWFYKKGKIKGMNNLAKKMLNFQITWNIGFFIVFCMTVARMVTHFDKVQKSFAEGYVSMSSNVNIAPILASALFLYVILYIYNLIFIIVNSIRINKGKSAVYFPSIPFLRK
jgi:uncharacterized Tic20 family protein